MVSERDSVTITYSDGNGRTVEESGLTLVEDKSFDLRPDRMTLADGGEPVYTIEKNKLQDKVTGRVVGIVENIQQSS